MREFKFNNTWSKENIIVYTILSIVFFGKGIVKILFHYLFDIWDINSSENYISDIVFLLFTLIMCIYFLFSFFKYGKIYIRMVSSIQLNADNNVFIYTAPYRSKCILSCVDIFFFIKKENILIIYHKKEEIGFIYLDRLENCTEEEFLTAIREVWQEKKQE